LYKQIARRLIKGWISTGIKTGYAHWVIDRFPRLYADPEPVVARLRHHLKMDCLLQDHVQSRIYFFGAYEPIEVHLLSTLLDKNSIFLDVGANVGFYSLMLSQTCSAGKVYAFEPVATNYKVLEKNINANRLNDRVQIIKKGLWNTNTTLEFSLPDEEHNNLGSFSAGKSDLKKNAVFCDVVTLDAFVIAENIKRIDAIKMDIEGAELFALKGGEKTLRQFRPIIQIELNRKACAAFDYSLQDLESFLKALDYRFYKVGHIAENSEFIDSFAGIEQVNVIALPKDKINKLDTQWKSREIKNSYINH
jgi:FkbM family methyltransferase